MPDKIKEEGPMTPKQKMTLAFAFVLAAASFCMPISKSPDFDLQAKAQDATSMSSFPSP